MMRIILLLAIALLFCTKADAQLRVDRMIAILDAESGGRADFEILNDSDETMYISNRLFEVIDPHTTAERVELTDPRAAPLIATPRDLVLGPGDRRLVRVFTTEDAAETDRVFRMTVAPQPEDFQSQGVGVQVLVGYDLLIIQPPDNPVVDYEVTREGSVIRIENRGNTNVFFDRIEACPEEDTCQSLGARRVYAGESDVIEVDSNARVRLRYRSADSVDVIER